MDSVINTINRVILDTWGGVLVLWVSIIGAVSKLLGWMGKKFLEGAGADWAQKFIEKVMPMFTTILDGRLDEQEEVFNSKIKEHEEKMQSKVDEIKKEISVYRKEKHDTKAILDLITNALIKDDEESKKTLLIVRDIYKNKLPNNDK